MDGFQLLALAPTAIEHLADHRNRAWSTANLLPQSQRGAVALAADLAADATLVAAAATAAAQQGGSAAQRHLLYKGRHTSEASFRLKTAKWVSSWLRHRAGLH
eukprot:scaffold187099_cov18-Tisochrysis_lutea.AAC.1